MNKVKIEKLIGNSNKTKSCNVGSTPHLQLQRRKNSKKN